jgi:hypothetical protein
MTHLSSRRALTRPAILALAFLVAACVAASPDRAAIDLTEVKFSDGGAAPPARLEDIAWFEGLWRGQVFDDRVDHRVMAPEGTQMPGLVRLYAGGDTSVYELSAFMEVGGTLTYRNRHFGADLRAFQAAEDYVDRPLVDIRDGIAYFDGITFAPDGPDRAVVSFVLTADDGSQQKHVVHYDRIDD